MRRIIAIVLLCFVVHVIQAQDLLLVGDGYSMLKVDRERPFSEQRYPGLVITGIITLGSGATLFSAMAWIVEPLAKDMPDPGAREKVQKIVRSVTSVSLVSLEVGIMILLALVSL